MGREIDADSIKRQIAEGRRLIARQRQTIETLLAKSQDIRDAERTLAALIAQVQSFEATLRKQLN